MNRSPKVICADNKVSYATESAINLLNRNYRIDPKALQLIDTLLSVGFGRCHWPSFLRPLHNFTQFKRGVLLISL